MQGFQNFREYERERERGMEEEREREDRVVSVE